MNKTEHCASMDASIKSATLPIFQILTAGQKDPGNLPDKYFDARREILLKNIKQIQNRIFKSRNGSGANQSQLAELFHTAWQNPARPSSLLHHQDCQHHRQHRLLRARGLPHRCLHPQQRGRGGAAGGSEL